MIITIITLMMILSVESCNNIQPVGNTEYEPIALTKAEQEIVNNTNEFSLNFFKACAAKESGNNCFVSPLSLSIALSMVANGAENETYNEIVKALGLEKNSKEEINAFFEFFVEALIEADNKTDLLVANSAWVANGFPIKDSYKNSITDNYDAVVKNIDFKKGDATKTINKWCSDKTYGMIDKMFDQIDPQMKLMILNALYFNGKWAVPFEKDDTYDENFKTASGNKTMSFMHHTFSNVKVEINDEAEICSIPYGNGAFSLVIAMPADENTDIDKFIKKIDEKKWDKWITALANPADVQLKMPKFKGSYSTGDKLISILNSMGINKAFTSDAEFKGISDIPLYISEALQKTAIEVDENGTKAAAVTSFGMKCTSVGPSDHIVFDVDRPFVYAIRESSTNAIIFIGKMVK